MQRLGLVVVVDPGASGLPSDCRETDGAEGFSLTLPYAVCSDPPSLHSWTPTSNNSLLLCCVFLLFLL